MPGRAGKPATQLSFGVIQIRAKEYCSSDRNICTCVVVMSKSSSLEKTRAIGVQSGWQLYRLHTIVGAVESGVTLNFKPIVGASESGVTLNSSPTVRAVGSSATLNSRPIVGKRNKSSSCQAEAKHHNQKQCSAWHYPGDMRSFTGVRHRLCITRRCS